MKTDDRGILQLIYHYFPKTGQKLPFASDDDLDECTADTVDEILISACIRHYFLSVAKCRPRRSRRSMRLVSANAAPAVSTPPLVNTMID